MKALTAAAALVLASPALAGPPAAPTVADLQGTRALSMAAYEGVAPNNDGIWVNTAALSARRRYAVEGSWLDDRDGAGADFMVASGSVVDSQSSSVTAGLAYARLLAGTYSGNHYTFSLSTPVGRGLYLGGAARWLQLAAPGVKVNAVTADASAFYQASSYVGVGVDGYNLVPVGHHDLAPRGMGGGVSVGTDTLFHVGFSWRGDFERKDKLTSRWLAGGELLLADYFPIRAGWVKDDTLGGQWWSVGAGFVTPTGLGIDFGYRQAIGFPGRRTLGLTLKLMLAGDTGEPIGSTGTYTGAP